MHDMTKKKAPTMVNLNDPIGILRDIGDAMHLEVMLYMPYVNGWLARLDDNKYVDMDSVGLAMLINMTNQYGSFVPADKKKYKH